MEEKNLTSVTQDLVRNQLDRRKAQVQLIPLAGDASNRKYFRVQVEGQGEDVQTFILMQLLDDQPAKVFEEATTLKEASELPFVNVHRYLDGLGLPLPTIHHYDKKNGLLLLEDLGDVLLERVVAEGDTERIEKLYRRSIEVLVDLQVGGARKPDPSCLAFQQSFNADLLEWEFDHYLEYGVEVLHDCQLNSAEKKIVKDVFGSVAKELAVQPPTLTHRDYHCRNILVTGSDDIALIDFQDALLGPAAYDLASLLRDSYVKLEEFLIDDLISHYLDLLREKLGETPDSKSFRRVFDLQSVQRNLKAAGRFVFIDVKKGNDKFLKDIPGTLVNVRRNLEKYEELTPVLEVFSKYVPEFASS